MTDSIQNFPPMHPVTRLGRVIQQLRSFDAMHSGELEAMARDLEAAGAPDVAVRLRIYIDMQRDESDIVVTELADIQSDISSDGPPAEEATPGSDPAINSPRRAKWLAEQAAETERLKAPMSRRDLFNPAGPKAEDQ